MAICTTRCSHKRSSGGSPINFKSPPLLTQCTGQTRQVQMPWAWATLKSELVTLGHPWVLLLPISPSHSMRVSQPATLEKVSEKQPGPWLHPCSSPENYEEASTRYSQQRA